MASSLLKPLSLAALLLLAACGKSEDPEAADGSATTTRSGALLGDIYSDQRWAVRVDGAIVRIYAAKGGVAPVGAILREAMDLSACEEVTFSDPVALRAIIALDDPADGSETALLPLDRFSGTLAKTGRILLSTGPSCEPVDIDLRLVATTPVRVESERVLGFLARIAAGEASPDSLLAACGVWVDRYAAMLELLRAAGVAIKPSSAGVRAVGAPRPDGPPTAYLHHDIHVRDISGAACMASAERALGIASHYSLLFEMSGAETLARDDFLALRPIIGDAHHVGLHGAPVDRALGAEFCDGDGRDCRERIAKHLFKRLDGAMSKNEIARARLLPEVEGEGADSFGERRFVADLFPSARPVIEKSFSVLKKDQAAFEDLFGGGEVYTAHGGGVVRYAADQRNAADGSREQAIWNLIAYLGQAQYLAKFENFGLPREINQLRRDIDYGYLSDNSPRHFWPGISRRVAEGVDFILLIHPYQWQAGRIGDDLSMRDGSRHDEASNGPEQRVQPLR